MSQSRKGSLLEAIINILIGYSINFTAQIWVFPAFGVHVTVKENLEMGLIFTVISIIRSYTLRRFFNLFHSK
jgi:hypothetical protein